ncbi:glycosyltransferase [Bradyrhizobium sp. 139]|uniref:glycosyltransferase n=1 Tax=Bradyrhizobium sp. 139 TaxID=2782616 RepID=UPI001FF83954|nr:glycosyltransferase [Bradyrhizobium sp. 139]
MVGGPLAVIRDIFAGLKEGFASAALVSASSVHRREIVINDLQAAAGSSFGRAIGLPKALILPWQLLRQIAKHDLLALHGPFPLAELAIVFGFARCKPLIVHWHGDVVAHRSKRWLRNVLERKTLRRAEAIVVSDHMLIDAMPQLNEHAGKCRVVPFGIDAAKFNWPQFTAGHINDRGRLVLACGPLVPQKGFDVLIRSAVNRSFEVWIIGEGPERPKLQRLIDEFGVSDRIRLLGSVPDCERLKLMCIADVFAMPSRTDAETFGLVQLEAMTAGRPIVNTALDTAVPRVARHGIEAITVPPDDAGQLGEAIDALIRDPERRRCMGHAAQARAAARYSASTFNASTEMVYREAMAARAKCPAAGITLKHDALSIGPARGRPRR